MELEDYVRVKVADKVRLRFIIRDVCQHFRRYANKQNDTPFYNKIQKLVARLGTPNLGHAPNTVGYVTALLDEYGVDLDAPAPFAAVEDRHAPLMVKVLFDPDKPLFVIIISTLNLLRNAITAAESGTSALLPPRFPRATVSLLVACRAAIACLRRHDPWHSVRQKPAARPPRA